MELLLKRYHPEERTFPGSAPSRRTLKAGKRPRKPGMRGFHKAVEIYGVSGLYRGGMIAVFP
jgi:hypothetical protein